MRSLYVFATRHCFRVPMALPSLGCLEPAHTVFEALTKSLEPARFTKAWICQTYLWSHFVSLSLSIYICTSNSRSYVHAHITLWYIIYMSISAQMWAIIVSHCLWTCFQPCKVFIDISGSRDLATVGCQCLLLKSIERLPKKCFIRLPCFEHEVASGLSNDGLDWQDHPPRCNGRKVTGDKCSDHKTFIHECMVMDIDKTSGYIYFRILQDSDCLIKYIWFCSIVLAALATLWAPTCWGEHLTLRHRITDRPWRRWCSEPVFG